MLCDDSYYADPLPPRYWKSRSGGEELPYKNDAVARRTVLGSKLVDWYRLGCIPLVARNKMK